MLIFSFAMQCKPKAHSLTPKIDMEDESSMMGLKRIHNIKVQDEINLHKLKNLKIVNSNWN
jgi:hypothetical protein